MRRPGRNPASGHLACVSGRPFFFADDIPMLNYTLCYTISLLYISKASKLYKDIEDLSLKPSK